MNEEIRLQIKLRGSKTSGSYGIIGKPTEIVDTNGNKLFIGDTVEVTSPNGDRKFISIVVKPVGSKCPFVMSIAGQFDKRGMLEGSRWKIKRVRKFSVLEVNEEISIQGNVSFIVRPY